MITIARAGCVILAVAVGWVGLAGTLRVPGEFPTIQAALDAASPGDVIEIAPGVYTEDLVIARSVTLRADLVSLGLPPGKFLFPWELEPGIQIVGTGRQPAAVVVKGDVSVTLEFLTVAGGRVAALMVEGQSRLTMRHAAIMKSNAIGILIRDWARVVLDACLVARNPSYGVLLLDAAEISLLNCVLVEKRGAALATSGSSRAEVIGSLILNNFFYGISAGGSRSLTVRDSVIRGNGFAGLTVGGEGLIEVWRSTVSSNRFAGIHATGRANLKLVENLIADNQGSGVLFSGWWLTLEAVSNHVVRNSGYGFQVSNIVGVPLPPALVISVKVVGRENWVPEPGEPDGNRLGALCPGIPGILDDPWPEGFLDP
ncbi:TPA: hypothetical protein DCY65_05115 [Candidatus Acetothermia bacterium]|nr:hypothetical protein [Candidatus Acetothermia bacterium]